MKIVRQETVEAVEQTGALTSSLLFFLLFGDIKNVTFQFKRQFYITIFYSWLNLLICALTKILASFPDRKDPI